VLLIDTSAKTGANSVILAGGGPVTGPAPSGAYEWRGNHIWAQRSDVNAANTGRFTLTADFASGKFSYATVGATVRDGRLAVSDGSISATSGEITSRTAMLRGYLHGPSANEVSGIFATTNSPSDASRGRFLAGFAGSGLIAMRKITKFDDGYALVESVNATPFILMPIMRPEP